MLLYFLITLGLGSLAGLLTIGWRQLSYVRANNLTELSTSDEYLGDIFQRRVDSSYDYFSFFFKRLVHLLSLIVLLALRRAVIISHLVVHRIEHKFSRLIDSVHGRTVLLKRGRVASPFLIQIKDHLANNKNTPA